MNIGFDAKRAFFNNTGLGNYSRALMQSLKKYFPEHTYISFSPKGNHTYTVFEKHERSVHPSNFFTKTFNAYWRSKGCVKEIKKNDIHLYHGLSHELPIGLEKLKVKKVVTIHDLIFERYPNQYSYFDRLIYKNKIIHACKIADKIVAISQQTKQDLIEIYQINEKKIHVISPSIDERFYHQHTDDEKQACQLAYHLPNNYLLSVGSLIERKNVLRICEALKQLPNTQLVVVGKGGEYKHKINIYLKENNMGHQVHFLEDKFDAKSIQTDLPLIYQCAKAFIYPSLFEGFGLPVLEALASRTPCITSNLSSMPEAGGDACIYVNPLSMQEIKQAIETLYKNNDDRNTMIEKGRYHAEKFRAEKIATQMMNLYNLI